MNEGPVYTKSFDFALRIIKLKKHLNTEHKEFDLARQILRSGTSIGANAAEAHYAQSKSDFISKMSVALKEASETEYWLKLLYAADYLTDNEFSSLQNDCEELISILSSIIKTSKDT